MAQVAHQNGNAGLNGNGSPPSSGWAPPPPPSATAFIPPPPPTAASPIMGQATSPSRLVSAAGTSTAGPSQASSSTSSAAVGALSQRSHKRSRDKSTPVPTSISHSASQGPLPRHLDSVIFGGYEIVPGFPSPYPLDELPPFPSASSSSSSASAPSVGKSKSPELGVDGRQLGKEKDKETEKPFKRLFVCDGCFKYMVQPQAHRLHLRSCQLKRPPGRKVYQRGAHIIWEIDGATQKLYCQNLCLFSKLFIEHKYMFFDVEGFMFYVLTDATPSQDFVLGYFSKEKVSYDDNNLACIVTYPPFQKKGYGTLLIEFSYELSRRTSASPGSPERPLSEQGQKGYLTYWTSAIVRYLQQVFAPAPIAASSSPAKSTNHLIDETDEQRRKRVRRARGWDGEIPIGEEKHSPSLIGEGGITVLIPRLGYGEGAPAEFSTDLEELAKAVNIRTEDVAHALVDSGLAAWRRPGPGGEDQVVIWKELVDQIALEKGVKPRAVLDQAHVLL